MRRFGATLWLQNARNCARERERNRTPTKAYPPVQVHRSLIQAKSGKADHAADSSGEREKE
jgi:hypothetical protein